MRTSLVLVLVALATAAHAKPPAPSASVVESLGDALAAVAAQTPAPQVIAVGEVHQSKATRAIPSSLRHFIDEVLPRLAPPGGHASDLIIETWVLAGEGCAAKAAEVGAKVDTLTQRPAETESEIVQLAKRAKALGVQPHILELSCAEYDKLVDKSGQLDAVALLGLVTDKLDAKIRALVKAGRPQILVYGGALHNDLEPPKLLERYAFGSAISKLVRGRYLEVDLYVPEFLAGDDKIAAERWYAAWHKARAPGKSVWVKRSPQSFVGLFAEQPAAQ